MTEPVAWKILRKNNWKWEIITDNPNNYFCQEAIPLYTKQQIQPKVQMTQAEFDEFEQIFRVEDYASLAIATIERVDITFNNLKSRIFSGSVDNRVKNENELNVLWANYNPDNPEETIEIVPNMKWFVRIKKRDDEGDYLFLSGSNLDDLEYFGFDYAMAFDTKEEAELWTNPLTETVQLPVEGE